MSVAVANVRSFHVLARQRIHLTHLESEGAFILKGRHHFFFAFATAGVL